MLGTILLKWRALSIEMSEPEKKSESAAVRPKTSINVQQFSGLFQKSRSPDVRDNTLVGPSGSSVLEVNRNGIRPLPNNVNLARTVRPLFQKPALSPVDLKKLNEYISSAKKNVANGEANPGASQEPPSQGKVTGKEMEKDKERESVIKRSKLLSKPTACKTKCEQENAIGSSSFEPTKNSNETAHYSLGTSSEVEGVDQFANTKTGGKFIFFSLKQKRNETSDFRHGLSSASATANKKFLNFQDTKQ